MNYPNQLFLCGGGLSMREGVDKGLWQVLENKFTLGLNFSYKFFNSTFTCFIDPVSFYRKHRHELKDLPLLVGRYVSDIKRDILPNTIFLKPCPNYTRDLNKGVYSCYLCGLWALSLAIYVLDVGEIYLLGFDNGSLPVEKKDNTITLKTSKGGVEIEVEKVSPELLKKIKKTVIIKRQIDKPLRAMSHWYQGKLEHRGVGRINFYHSSNKTNDLFKVYLGETKCKIFNVSPKSNLTVFPKLSYDEMFSRINPEIYNQAELQAWVRNKLELLPTGIK